MSLFSLTLQITAGPAAHRRICALFPSSIYSQRARIMREGPASRALRPTGLASARLH